MLMKGVLEACSVLLFLLVRLPGYSQPYDWQVRRSPADEHLYAVTYGKGLYVAAGNHRTILTSANGAKWRVRVQNTNSQGWFSGVAYGNGTFVAVGNGYQQYWRLSSPPTFGPPGSAGYSTNTNSAPIAVSTDGIHWRALRRGQKSLSAVAFGKERFVAVGLDGIITSRDGFSWLRPDDFYGPTGERLPHRGADVAWNLAPPAPTEVAYGNGGFVVLGLRGCILVSTNGLHWVYHGALQQWIHNFTALTFNGLHFITAHVEHPVHKTFVARNGADWREVASPFFYVWALGAGPLQRVLAVGSDFKGHCWLQLSFDGVDWSGTPTQISGLPYAVTHGKRGWVVVGAKGMILQSTLRPPPLEPL
jgi:hypothetical protein